jgi:hypothetical protein
MEMLLVKKKLPKVNKLKKIKKLTLKKILRADFFNFFFHSHTKLKKLGQKAKNLKVTNLISE